LHYARRSHQLCRAGQGAKVVYHKNYKRRKAMSTNKYKLICMSFDGEYQEEKPEFNSLEDLAEYDNDLGSKWFFYPYHFAIKGKTIANEPDYPLDFLKGKRLSTVSKMFNHCSKNKDAEGMDIESFSFFVADQAVSL
jgi:hypothetical protein